jgi:superfamily II DNA helicase RecQ
VLPAIADNVTILVVAPLRMLVESAMIELKRFKISCARLRDLDLSQSPVHQVIFVAGEELTVERLRALRGAAWENRVAGVVYDEAHLILSWGDEKTGFRRMLKRSLYLRAVFPNVPVTVLSGSPDFTLRSNVVDLFGLKDPIVVNECCLPKVPI